jgi:O-antigen/teichoic acid export membrane protein
MLKQHPQYSRLLEWGKLISITGSAQVVVQGVGFVAGILIIRYLPVQEYAFYTLVNTMLGMISVLSDGGISTGVMSSGAKVWKDKNKLGVILETGLDLRKKFAKGSLIVSVPILFYLLIHNGASVVMSLLIAASMIPAFYATLSDSLLEIVPKLHQNILPLQKNQVAVGIGRLILTALTMFIFPWAFVAILATGIPRIWGNFQLRDIVYKLVAKNQKPDNEIRIGILKLVRRILPSSIYYTFSGQISIWLISIFGNTTSLAQLGALGRLSMLLGLFSSIISMLIIPRFAKLAEQKNLLLQRFLQLTGGLSILFLLIILVVYLFPSPILWLLGKSYYGLEKEFVLSIIASCTGLMSGVIFSIYTCRGWAIRPEISITINISAIVILASILDLSSLQGALYLNIGIALVGFLQTSIFCLIKIVNVGTK